MSDQNSSSVMVMARTVCRKDDTSHPLLTREHPDWTTCPKCCKPLWEEVVEISSSPVEPVPGEVNPVATPGIVAPGAPEGSQRQSTTRSEPALFVAAAKAANRDRARNIQDTKKKPEKAIVTKIKFVLWLSEYSNLEVAGFNTKQFHRNVRVAQWDAPIATASMDMEYGSHSNLLESLIPSKLKSQNTGIPSAKQDIAHWQVVSSVTAGNGALVTECDEGVLRCTTLYKLLQRMRFLSQKDVTLNLLSYSEIPNAQKLRQNPKSKGPTPVVKGRGGGGASIEAKRAPVKAEPGQQRTIKAEPGQQRAIKTEPGQQAQIKAEPEQQPPIKSRPSVPPLSMVTRTAGRKRSRTVLSDASQGGREEPMAGPQGSNSDQDGSGAGDE